MKYRLKRKTNGMDDINTMMSIHDMLMVQENGSRKTMTVEKLTLVQ